MPRSAARPLCAVDPRPPPPSPTPCVSTSTQTTRRRLPLPGRRPMEGVAKEIIERVQKLDSGATVCFIGVDPLGAMCVKVSASRACSLESFRALVAQELPLSRVSANEDALTGISTVNITTNTETERSVAFSLALRSRAARALLACAVVCFASAAFLPLLHISVWNAQKQES